MFWMPAFAGMTTNVHQVFIATYKLSDGYLPDQG